MGQGPHVDAEQVGVPGGQPVDEEIGVTQFTDGSGAEQRHDGTDLGGPATDLGGEPSLAFPVEHAEEMAGDADGPRAQGERLDHVQRIAHATRSEHVDADRIGSLQRFEQAQRGRLPPLPEDGEIALGTAGILDHTEIGATPATHVDGGDAESGQFADRRTAHPETDLLDHDRHVDGLRDGADAVRPGAEVAVSLGHDDLLREVDVNLQGIGVEHPHGLDGLVRAHRGANVGEHEARGLLADHREGRGQGGVSQRGVL